MSVSGPNSIKTINSAFTFYSDFLSKLWDGLGPILASNTPSDFGDMIDFTDGHEGISPSVSHMLEMVRLESWLGFVETLDFLGFASQIDEVRGLLADVEVKIKSGE